MSIKVDGYVSWEEFQRRHDVDHVDWPSDFPRGCKEKYQKSVSFRLGTGERVTLFDDGTWTFDCAPDWDGSS